MMSSHSLKGGPYGAVSPPERQGLRFHLYSIASLALVPSLVFDIVNVIVALLSYRHFGIAAFVVITCAFLALVFLIVNRYNRAGPFYTFIGALCFVAIANGTWCGSLLSANYWAQYWTYEFGATYTNVSPVEPAAGYIDAGLVGFTSGTLVDSQQALGVNVAMGPQYCVAPIFDESQQSRAEFWAVGLDCCESRLGFFCDDADDEMAKSGLVLPDTDSMFSPHSHEHFLDVVKQAGATYHIEIPENPVLLRWAADAEESAKHFMTRGILFLVVSCFVYFLISLVLGVVLHMRSRRQVP